MQKLLVQEGLKRHLAVMFVELLWRASALLDRPVNVRLLEAELMLKRRAVYKHVEILIEMGLIRSVSQGSRSTPRYKFKKYAYWVRILRGHGDGTYPIPG